MKKLLTFLFTLITIVGFSQSRTVTVGDKVGKAFNSDSLGGEMPAYYVDTLNDQNLFGSKIFKDDLVLDSTLSIGVSSPDGTAILDITSTTKGLLPPRMTDTQRDAISTPAEGLQIHDNVNNVPNFFDGTNWRRFSHTTTASLEEGGVVVSESSNGSGIFTDSANFFWDNTNKRLGIGTTAPLAKLHVAETSTGATRGVVGDQYSTDLFGSVLSLRKARGTVSAPSSISASDILGQLGFYGYHSGGAFATNANASVRATAVEAFTSSAQGTLMSFWTTPIGANASSERMRIDNAGNVGIGTSSPAHNLHLVGNFALGDTTAGDIDAIIYFGDDGDVTAESIKWDDGNSRFEFSDGIFNTDTTETNVLKVNGISADSIIPATSFTGNLANSTTTADTIFTNVVQSNLYNYAADTGSTDAYKIVLSSISSYVTGLKVTFLTVTANTAAATLTINGLAAKTIKKLRDQDLATGDIEASQIVEAVYDGSFFQITSQLAQ